MESFYNPHQFDENALPFIDTRFPAPEQMSRYYQPGRQIDNTQESAAYQSLLRNDTQNPDFYNYEQAFREAQVKESLKRDKRLNRVSGQLPYLTTPRLFNAPGRRMIPESTRDVEHRIRFNQKVDEAGPFYLRHWQIFDNAPFLPSSGDVTKDPRYSIMTKGSNVEYQMAPGGLGVFRTAAPRSDRPPSGPGFEASGPLY